MKVSNRMFLHIHTSGLPTFELRQSTGKEYVMLMLQAHLEKKVNGIWDVCECNRCVCYEKAILQLAGMLQDVTREKEFLRALYSILQNPKERYMEFLISPTKWRLDMISQDKGVRLIMDLDEDNYQREPIIYLTDDETNPFRAKN